MTIHPTIIKVGIFTAGALVGSVTTLLVTKKIFTVNAQKSVDESVAQSEETLRAYYDHFYKSKYETKLANALRFDPEKHAEFIASATPKVDIPGDEYNTESTEIVGSKRTRKEKIADMKKPKPEPGASFKKPDYVSPESQVLQIVRDRNTPPILIDEQEYNMLDNDPDFGDYSRITITYFQGDDTLVDERMDVLDPIDMFVPEEALDGWGMNANNPDVVYVRNDRLEILFEIVRDMDAYTHSVLGMDLAGVDPENPKKYRRV